MNHALPAWDIATGLNAVIGILAAERQRHTTGEGQLVKISLADVAFTMVANLGFLGQAAGAPTRTGRRSATTCTARSAATSPPATAAA